MSEKKFGVWEQPKDGSANGQWTCGSTRLLHFETMKDAQGKANIWNDCRQVCCKHLHHEARELPEAWWNLTSEAIFKLIRK